MLLDSFEYFLDCSSTPTMMRSTTVGSNFIIMVVRTLILLHFISYFFRYTLRYMTASVVGQELSMARRSWHEVLYCFCHLTWAAMESIDNLFFISPSFV